MAQRAMQSPGIDRIDCIKKLPDADRAMAMLEQLKRHCGSLEKASDEDVKDSWNGEVFLGELLFLDFMVIFERIFRYF